MITVSSAPVLPQSYRIIADIFRPCIGPRGGELLIRQLKQEAPSFLTHKKLKGPREIYRAMCQTKVVDIYILLLFDISRDRLAEDTLNTSRIRPIFYASRALFALASRPLPTGKHGLPPKVQRARAL